MDKAIGFTAVKLPFRALAHPRLSDYPWLKTFHFVRGDWDVIVWGHGDLSKFDTPEGYIVGYSDVELDILKLCPLQNRGVLLRFGSPATIINDFAGQLPVFYGQRNGIPIVSSCEECVVIGCGGVTLDRARLVQYLIFQSYVGTATLWNEVNKLYANSILVVTDQGDFQQIPQAPLQFGAIPKSQVTDTIADISERTIRRYTDPLDDVHLPLSRGKDSGVLLGNMSRPNRIHARTMPTSWPLRRNEDVVITRARCRNAGVDDHQIVNFPGQTYQQYVRPQIEYAGTPLASTQAYIFGIAAWMGAEGNRWPVISGSCGDITAGSGLARILEVYKVRQTGDNLKERFKIACYCQSKEWRKEAFDLCLSYDWDLAIGHSELRSEWARLWKTSEGATIGVDLDLIRFRNRGSQYITYAWAATDLWGSYVAPFTDRKYVETMLSLPQSARELCIAQRRYGKQYFPGIMPDGGMPRSAWDVANTINDTSVSHESLWPLVENGSRPAHPLFNPVGVRNLYARAMTGDMKAAFWLQSLQPLAYMIERGHVYVT